MKKELLSPAGNMDCLIAAIHGGADAIYIGGNNFGARKFAKNFTITEIEEALKLCHLYGVKLYITVNTIIYEEEIDECLNYVDILHKIGVDAVIVQDIGLMTTIRKVFPNLEIHASTQCHTYNENQINLFKDLGIKRVVLAREMSIDEINNINTDIELETFIHGALCISYSGQCLFSSLIMNRSGNRGECAGMCRLPYNLIENNKTIISDKYLLSPKELSTIDNFKYLMQSNITSFKIEGRMKSKEYVFLINKIYRTLIDKYNNNEELSINNEDIKNLKTIFNREFTSGHLFNDRNNLMNIESPNHKGIKIGEVIKFDKKYITIKLNDFLYQEDGIRFGNKEGFIVNYLYDLNNNLINKTNDIVKVDNKINLDKLTEVYKTSSNRLNKEINKYQLRKINISFNIKARINQKLEIIIDDGNNKILETGQIVNKSINNPVTKEAISSKLSKTGNSIYRVNNINYDIDNNIFIASSELNKIRRNLIEKLNEIRIKNKNNYLRLEDKEPIKFHEANHLNISCQVNNKEQLEAVLNNINGDIYITDYDLYKKYKSHKNIYYQVPRLTRDINYTNDNLLITDLSQIYNNKNNLISDYYLNIVNSKSINYLFNNNINKVILSPELNINSIKSILKSYNKIPKIEVIIYEQIELMLMKHCLIKSNTDRCNCKINKYFIEDRNKKRYEIKVNDGYSKILSYKRELYKDEEIKELLNIGIKNYKISFYQENKKEIDNIIKKYQNLLQIK